MITETRKLTKKSVKSQTALKQLSGFCDEHPLLITGVLFGLYLLGFSLLETYDPANVFLIDLNIDHLIPFSRYASVFYCLWHAEIPVILIFAFLKRNREEYWELTISLLAGMFLILLICTVFPSQIDLRPQYIDGNDLFTYLTKLVYSLDDNQNVFPSGHAFGSVLMAIGWYRFTDLPWKRIIAIAVNVLIVLSTLFLKQHSIIDVAAGILLAFFINYIVSLVIQKIRSNNRLS